MEHFLKVGMGRCLISATLYATTQQPTPGMPCQTRAWTGMSQHYWFPEMIYTSEAFGATGDKVLEKLGNIARYDTTSGKWHSLPNDGLDNLVSAMGTTGDDLYIGGDFDETGDGTLQKINNIVRFNTEDDQWYTLPKMGLTGLYTAWVDTIVISGSHLYIGGNFSTTGDGTVENLGNIVRIDIDDGTYYPLPNKGLNGALMALALSKNNLYAGGQFDETGDESLKNLGNIARYDIAKNQWNALPNKGLKGPSGLFFTAVWSLTAVGSDLFVGGNFYSSGDEAVPDLNFATRYDTEIQSWHALPNQGLCGSGVVRDNQGVSTIKEIGSNLYIGGDFIATCDGVIEDLNLIARFSLDVPGFVRFLPLMYKR